VTMIAGELGGPVTAVPVGVAMVGALHKVIA
jgi:hypothetical protein